MTHPIGQSLGDRLCAVSRICARVWDETRRAHEGGEPCVCELTDPLGLTQPTISHLLKILVEAGISTRDQRGKWAYYALVLRALDALSAVLCTST